MTRKNRPALSARPRLETLEDRVMPTVYNHGGPILPSVQAQAVYLGSDWQTNTFLNGETNSSHSFDGFLQAITSGTYMDMLGNAGYTGPGNTVVGRGSAVKGVIDPMSIPVTNLLNYSSLDPMASPTYDPLTDSQIQGELQKEITSKLVQNPSANALYVVFVEDNIVVDFGDGTSSLNSFLAYHSSFAGEDANGNSAQVRYAVIPYAGSYGFLNGGGKANAKVAWLSSFDSMTETASHELAEAVTDPDFTTWFDPVGNEIGDIVNQSMVYLNGYAVQREASISASTSNFLGMVPAGATAGHQVAFSLEQGGALFEFGGGGETQIHTPGGLAVTAVSDQGIDPFGQPMIDIILSNSAAYEYHDFPAGNAFAAHSPSLFPFTFLGTGVKQARAGDGVSYVLFANGNLEEFVDTNYNSPSGFGVNPTPQSGGVIARNVVSIDAGTDRLGVNSVDYTVMANGTTSLFEWRDVTAASSLLAANDTAFSDGQQGMHAYVSGGAAFLFNESTSQTSAVLNPLVPGGIVTSVTLGVSAGGQYQLEVIYSNGLAYEYLNATKSWALLGTNVRAVSKTLNGVSRILLTTGAAYEHGARNPALWADANDLAVA
jgi:hypothetical protein